MAQVTNQLPYEELKPLPQAKEVYPRLAKLMQKVVLAVSVIFLSMGAGAVLGLCNWGISVFTGTLAGGVLGLIAGIAMAMLTKLPTNVEEYRIETLDQIKSITGNPRALSALKTLRDFFYYPFKELQQNSHLHLLHGELAAVGDFIDSNRADARKVWSEFLTHLNATPFSTPDGEKALFNGASLLNRFSGKLKQVKREWLSSWSPSDEDLQSIEQIGKEAFGKSYAFPADRIKKTLAEYRPSGMRIARNKETEEILGFGWYYTENGVVKIAEIARKPEACRLNIGCDILQEIINAQKPGQPIQICLRRSNPFIGRLQNWKFVRIQELPKYYDTAPPEDGILMELNWQEYSKML
ncbi:MAG: hypothetical protein K1000chlam3_00568 [Chlamydiae bacterium]|nr:hypothetical protein [Chlamydiota bacterium]